ncbi:MAG: hypothetical protein ACRCWG_00665 [Sarcina sp.]
MRVKNALNNIKFGMIFFVVSTILSFVSRTVLIKYIGIDYAGVNSVLKNIIGIMSVAELGISVAITYSLYKPLREKNNAKVGELLVLYKNVYRIIAGIILGISIILAFFLNRIVNNANFSYKALLSYFIIYVVITVTSYIFNYIQILAIADQQNNIVTKITGYVNLVKVVLQVATGIYFKSYELWLIIELLFTVATYIYVNLSIKKKYYYIEMKTSKTFKELCTEYKSVFIDTRDLFIHKIAGIVVFQTDSIVLAIFTNIQLVAIYGNYIMITTVCLTFVGNFINGISAGVGDLIAEGKKERIIQVWRYLFYLNSTIALIISYCVFININKLMDVWMGKSFVFDRDIVFFLCINMYIMIKREVTETYKSGFGIFWDNWAALIEALVNLIFSVILVQYIGVVGIVIGTFLSNILIISIWKPFVVFKYGFKVNPTMYLVTWGKGAIVAITAIICSYFLQNYLVFETGSQLINFIISSFESLIFISLFYLAFSSVYREYREYNKNIIFKVLRIAKIIK